MVLATAAPDGTPSARAVLLKGVDELGFVLFTNHGSRKGRQMLANPPTPVTSSGSTWRAPSRSRRPGRRRSGAARLELVAPVRPVAPLRPARLMEPAAVITPSTADLVLGR